MNFPCVITGSIPRRKTRLETHIEDSHLSREFVALFEYRICAGSSWSKRTGALIHGGAQEITMSCCASPWRQRANLVVETGPTETSEHGLRIGVVLCFGGEAWPIDRCPDKDVGRSERETPDLL